MYGNITDRLIDAITELFKHGLPPGVVEQVKLCLIDYIACANIGHSLRESSDEVLLSRPGAGIGTTSVVGGTSKTDMHTAAIINGMDAHAAELDDGHRYAMMHPGAVVITAMLSLAQNSELKEEDFIRGIAAGYEASIRLGAAVQPEHKLKGFHGTGTCGTLGAALGMGVAAGLSKSEMKTLLSCACAGASGLLAMQDDSSGLKPYNIGVAAASAIDAFMMAKTGLTGPDDVLGGKRGFFRVFAGGSVNEDFLLEGFDGKYAIELIYRKLYGACRHCHPAAEASLKLLRERGADFEGAPADINSIEKITVETYDLAVNGHDQRTVSTVSQARMSIPYCVAVSLVYGSAGYERFTEECLENEDVKALMMKVEVTADEELSKLVPGMRAARVKIHASGKVYEARVDYPKGEPENPISKEELEEKYFSLMEAVGRTRDYGKRLLELIWNLEEYYDGFLKEV